MTSVIRRSIATAVVFSLSLSMLAPATLAGPLASMQGRIVGDADVPSRSGLVVHLLDADGTERYRSAPTGTDGAFSIGDAEAGSYRVLVEAPAGAYLVDQPVGLESGSEQHVLLSLNGQANYQTTEGFGTSASAFSGWVKWLVFGLIGAGALFVIVEASDDETPASPF